MKNINKLLALTLAAALLFCACRKTDTPADETEEGFSYETAVPSDGNGLAAGKSVEVNGFVFKLSDDGKSAVVTGYNGTATDAAIPDSVEGYPVTEIAAGAMQINDTLTSIDIPASVTKIGDDALANCANLAALKGCDGVTDIGSGAFADCPFILASSEMFVTVGNILFKYNGAEAAVTVPDGIRVIAGAFQGNTAVTSVALPSSVVSIADTAFGKCSSLQSIALNDGLTHIGDRSFSMCTSLTSLTLPDSVTHIGAHAFLFCSSMTEVKFSENIKTIGNSAFQSCSALTSLELPSGVESIGDSAFMSCSNLTFIYIPYSVTYVGAIAFGKCSDALVVQCTEGSAADVYCRENSIQVMY